VEEKLDISRIGNIIELDPYRIDETLQNGNSTFVSPLFYNKGVYRVKNSQKKTTGRFCYKRGQDRGCHIPGPCGRVRGGMFGHPPMG